MKPNEIKITTEAGTGELFTTHLIGPPPLRGFFAECAHNLAGVDDYKQLYKAYKNPDAKAGEFWKALLWSTIWAAITVSLLMSFDGVVFYLATGLYNAVGRFAREREYQEATIVNLENLLAALDANKERKLEEEPLNEGNKADEK